MRARLLASSAEHHVVDRFIKYISRAQSVNAQFLMKCQFSETCSKFAHETLFNCSISIFDKRETKSTLIKKCFADDCNYRKTSTNVGFYNVYTDCFSEVEIAHCFVTCAVLCDPDKEKAASVKDAKLV